MSINVERATWTIPKEGLLRDWYDYWVKKGGKKPYQEDLCHFMRVLLFWAPSRWFFRAHTKTTKLVTPWSVTLVALIDYGFIVAPHAMLALLVTILQWLVIAAAIVITAAVLWIVVFVELIGMKRVEAAAKWLSDAMDKKVLNIPLWGYFWIILAALFVIADTHFTLYVLIAAAAITLVGAVLILIGAVVKKIYDKIPKPAPKPYKRGKFEEAVDDFIKLSVGYVTAKKHKICPLIDFEPKETEKAKIWLNAELEPKQ